MSEQAATQSGAAGAGIKPFVIERTFDAPRGLMWKAWTEPERMLHWFGPKGGKMIQAKMDLRPGGIYHYCLQYGEGAPMWGKFVYREIAPQDRMVWINSFSDAEGGITRHPMSPTWPRQLLTVVTFSGAGNKTTVRVEWTPIEATAEELETFENAREGMGGGWGGTFDQLAEYLASLA
jgi:uncharacterized protein YndB with AHSA1/START domain